MLDPTSYDYREIACPQCQQAAGSYCKRPSGHSGPFVTPHSERRTQAHAIWRDEERRLYGEQVTSWPDDEKAPVPAAQRAPRIEQLALFNW